MFAKARGALAVAVFAGSDDGHEPHAGVARRERIVNVVAEVERRRRIALTQDFPQALGMRLALGIVQVMTVRKCFAAGQFSNVKENSRRVRPVKRFSSKLCANFSICREVTISFSFRTFPGLPSLPQ